MAGPKAKKLYCVAFLEDDDDRKVLKDALKTLSIKGAEINKGGYREAIEHFEKNPSPEYLIVDISSSDIPISDLTTLAEVCDPDVKVMVVGSKNDVALYRDLMNMGISEYLFSPLFPDILTTALKNLFGEESTDKGTKSAKIGKTIAFIGARGGVGTSVVANNFGAFLTHDQSRRSVLVDLDLQFGTSALYFDLKGNYGLRDVLENPSRVDQLFLERIFVPVNERFVLLSSQEDLEGDHAYTEEGINLLFGQLEKQFQYVLVDLPHQVDQLTKTVLSKAQIVVVISDPTVAGLRDTGRLLKLIGKGSDKRIYVVLNKVGAIRKLEVSPKDFQEAMGQNLDHIIPYDDEAPILCVNQGKSLIDQETPFGDSVRELVEEVLGKRRPEESGGGISGFLKRLKLS